MIENLCSRKKDDIHTTTLPYANNPIQQKSFESFSECGEIASSQLNFIGYYMKDFRIILDDFKTSKPKNPTADEDS